MTTLQLPDGRSLDVQVSGPDTGSPLVFHHGTPGSVIQFRSVQRAAHRRGLRLVTYSRPGYGASPRVPGRRVVDAAADVAAILNHLEAPRCVVAGWSGGGPHALATGARLHDRVAGVLVIAGVAPFDAVDLDFLDGMGAQNIDEFSWAVTGESELQHNLRAEAVGLRAADATGLIAEMASLLPDIDRAALTDEFGEDMVASFGEALRLDVNGWVDDDLAFVAPWGFSLGEIAVPTFVWQGSTDLMVPFAHGQWLAQHVPGVTAHLHAGEGHLSITIGALDLMLDELASTLRRVGPSG